MEYGRTKRERNELIQGESPYREGKRVMKSVVFYAYEYYVCFVMKTETNVESAAFSKFFKGGGGKNEFPRNRGGGKYMYVIIYYIIHNTITIWHLTIV